jgi:hypothetical protein
MHVQWTMARVKEILKDKSLTGVGVNANRGVRILILPFYKAQVQHYLIEIQKLKDSKELSGDDVQRIRVLTLDSSLGDQEDIVIGDLSQTDVPGFCGEPERINLLLTRPIIGQLILMEKGMWLVSDRSERVVRQTLCLRELYIWLKKEMCVATTVCCDRCETFGMHKTTECPAKKRKDGKEDMQPESPQICDNCKAKGHATNDCGIDPQCPRCHDKKHLAYECTSFKFCANCQVFGHLTHLCPHLLRSCYSPL